jgi:tetratricopeptide (TPR) repeat protein
MLGISEQQLRSWERQGLIPACEAFSFSDLIAVRTLRKLRENRISPKQIGHAIQSLREKFSGVEHPLSELKISPDGKTIAVQVAGQKMEAVSGQMFLNFDSAAGAAIKTLPEKKQPDERWREKQAEMHFQRGLAFEETGAPIEEAIQAYRAAIELNSCATGALVNLGTIYYRMRRFGEAESYYQRAIAVDSAYALAHFNLGNLYDETGNLSKAQEYYELALRIHANYADAHFNMALLCERTGDLMKAVRHWKAYLRLDSGSSWAEIARRQLEKLKDASIIRSR